jgi:hypothetical protein
MLLGGYKATLGSGSEGIKAALTGGAAKGADIAVNDAAAATDPGTAALDKARALAAEKAKAAQKTAADASARKEMATTISGNRPTVVNINFEKALVQALNVSVADMREGASEIRKIVEGVLVDALTNAKRSAQI